MDTYDGRLDKENISPCCMSYASKLFRVLRYGAYCCNAFPGLYLFDPFSDKFFLDRLCVKRLHKFSGFFRACMRYFFKHLCRIRIPGLNAIQVQDRYASQLRHLYREFHVHNPVHGSSKYRHLIFPASEFPARVNFLRVYRNRPRHKRYFVKTITSPCFPASSYPFTHIAPL